MTTSDVLVLLLKFINSEVYNNAKNILEQAYGKTILIKNKSRLEIRDMERPKPNDHESNALKMLLQLFVSIIRANWKIETNN